MSDLVVHGENPFPHDIEELLVRIDELGREQGAVAFGRALALFGSGVRMGAGTGLGWCTPRLAQLLEMMEAGRGDELLIDPITKRPLSEG